jgi:hypothetical protein
MAVTCISSSRNQLRDDRIIGHAGRLAIILRPALLPIDHLVPPASVKNTHPPQQRHPLSHDQDYLLTFWGPLFDVRPKSMLWRYDSKVVPLVSARTYLYTLSAAYTSRRRRPVTAKHSANDRRAVVGKQDHRDRAGRSPLAYATHPHTADNPTRGACSKRSG